MDLSVIMERLDHIEKMIRSNKNVLNVEEAVEYTGLSRSFLYKLTAKGEIPFSKPRGKLLYFSREKLDQWLLSNEQKSNRELNSEAVEYSFRRKRF
ncbi:MAG: helix-turn-helix domain-containing protein [Salegentibacter mishustinae]|nr:helix-turn-helix domain-containing protein [Salegentibacter mishustinae]